MDESMRVGRRTVTLTRPDKVLFPDVGLTKRDLVHHYLRVAPRMLPFLRNRPLSMHRFPNGIGGPGFFHKTAPESFPDWVRREAVPKRSGGEIVQVVCDDAATLCVVANYGCITPHVTLSRLDRPDQPDRLIFDVDPPPGASFSEVRRAARLVREVLDELGLRTWLTTTGSSGVHVLVPLDRDLGFDEVREFARAVAREAVARHPRWLTVEPRKANRGDRVYLDVLRNGYAQLAVAPYAVRALPDAPVATPISWDELDAVGPRQFTLRTLPDRLDAPDPWADLPRRGHRLSRAIDALSAR